MKGFLVLLLLAAIGYTAWQYAGDFNTLFTNRVEYDEVSIMPCTDVLAALAAPAGDATRAKVTGYLNGLSFNRFKIENLSETNPSAFFNLTTQFRQICQGENYLPNKDIFMRITRKDVLGN